MRLRKSWQGFPNRKNTNGKYAVDPEPGVRMLYHVYTMPYAQVVIEFLRSCRAHTQGRNIKGYDGGWPTPQPWKFAVSQGKNGSTVYFCRATYWTQDHYWKINKNVTDRKCSQGTLWHPQKFVEVTSLPMLRRPKKVSSIYWMELLKGLKQFPSPFEVLLDFFNLCYMFLFLLGKGSRRQGYDGAILFDVFVLDVKRE